MSKVIVNGRELTPEENAAHSARMRALHGGLDEIFRTGRAPGCMTDSVFLAGMSTNGSQFEHAPDQGDYYRGAAEARGQSTKGKVYLSGLAAFPGDPRAWVDGRGDVARVLEERGWNGAGAVNVKAPPAEAAPERVAVAEDLLDGAVLKELHHDPGLADMDPGELRHEVREKIKPHWSD